MLNKKETLLARQKQKFLKEEFENWIFRKKQTYKAIYNACFNSIRNREYDGMPDRYDDEFRNINCFEFTYDIEDNLHEKEEKLSILEQIKSFQSE
ncbi:hypothetical protein [Eggerthia catenaformis]|uniref:hypothetical protein n=1 Tax=Eggerthia catenaformis TaxID=31973 RepID=UPI003CD0D915